MVHRTEGLLLNLGGFGKHPMKDQITSPHATKSTKGIRTIYQFGYMYLDWIIVTYGVPYVIGLS